QEKTQPCVWRDETLLLSSYEQNQKSYENGQINNLKFLKLIMEQMKAHKVDEIRESCINKMENLKKSYKKPKTLTINDMLSKKPWIKPLSLAGNSVSLSLISNDSLTLPPCKILKKMLKANI
ncbi:hypothetical protein PV326_000784, partial [Microctonus aethiopoides]